MEEDVCAYVNSCSIYNQKKTLRHPLAGLSQRLPVPHRFWSNISLDFIIGLPPSIGHTIIFTVVARLSKMAHFIPLLKLPSIKEFAKFVL